MPTRSQRYSNKKQNQPGPSQAPLLQDADDDDAIINEEPDVNMDEDVYVGNEELVSAVEARNVSPSAIMCFIGSESKSRGPCSPCSFLRTAPHCFATRRHIEKR